MVRVDLLAQDFVRQLLAAKVPLDSERAQDGLTALVAAAHNGYWDTVDALLEAKASANAACAREDGICPLIAAAEQASPA
jgi:ankyrin repeat protein